MSRIPLNKPGLLGRESIVGEITVKFGGWIVLEFFLAALVKVAIVVLGALTLALTLGLRLALALALTVALTLASAGDCAVTLV